MTLQNRISAIALGIMAATALTLPAAFAQEDASNAAPHGSATHQWAGHGGKHKGMRGCGGIQQLGLSEQQKAQLKTARETFRKENAPAIESIKSKFQQLKQLGKDPANQSQRQALLSQIKQERKALMEKRKASMQGILTPEQQSKWESIKQQCKAQRQGMRHHGPKDANQSTN
jgi:Spy/CpxP family protein refolding chaperone